MSNVSWWGRSGTGRRYTPHAMAFGESRTLCGRPTTGRGFNFLSARMPEIGACPQCAIASAAIRALCGLDHITDRNGRVVTPETIASEVLTELALGIGGAVMYLEASRYETIEAFIDDDIQGKLEGEVVIRDADGYLWIAFCDGDGEWWAVRPLREDDGIALDGVAAPIGPIRIGALRLPWLAWQPGHGTTQSPPAGAEPEGQ